MADCKHEKIVATGDHTPAYFFCDDKCSKEIAEDDVVILTKAQHDKMNAVVEAGKGLMAYRRKGSSNQRRELEIEEMKDRLFDALTALEGE